MQLIEMLGIRVTAATMAELNQLLGEGIANGERWIVANHNLHSVHLFQRNPKLRLFFDQARLAHIDGMSLVLLARLLGFSLSREQRVTYVDWVRPLMREAEGNGWRVFFLGSKPGVGDEAARILRQEFPRLELACHHGYFDMSAGSSDNERLLSTINSYRPQVLMVGLGMPRQEQWILDHWERLDTNIILPAGACMDYVAGAVATPPRWMGRVGLEWLYRLGCEPGRLWTRYLVEPWFIAGLLIKELLLKLAVR